MPSSNVKVSFKPSIFTDTTIAVVKRVSDEYQKIKESGVLKKNSTTEVGIGLMKMAELLQYVISFLV